MKQLLFLFVLLPFILKAQNTPHYSKISISNFQKIDETVDTTKRPCELEYVRNGVLVNERGWHLWIKRVRPLKDTLVHLNAAGKPINVKPVWCSADGWRFHKQ